MGLLKYTYRTLLKIISYHPYLSLLVVLLPFFHQDHVKKFSFSMINLEKNEYPSQVVIEDLYPKSVDVEYTFDLDLQNHIQEILNQQQPDYSGIVVIDAENGQILANNFFSSLGAENYNFDARFTSASIFKVVTAAAVVNEQLLEPTSKINHIGRTTTMWRWQLKRIHSFKKWMTKFSLEDSLAKSINAVFGKIGIYMLGPSMLHKYSVKAGFEQDFISSHPIETSTIQVPSSSIETARLASGYGHLAKLSPIHGALIASAFINGGKVMNPQFFKKATWNSQAYFPKPKIHSQFVSIDTALELSHMMKKTITHGTARRHFRSFLRKYEKKITQIGGKTGHLYGYSPDGYYDWFIAFLELRGTKGGKPKRIATAVLNISKEKWKFKPTWITRKVFEHYIQEYSL